MANYYALIKNSIVQNVILAEESFITDLVNAETIDEGVLIEGDTRPNIGDRYSGGNFVTALTKPQAIAIRLTEFRIELQNFIECRYDTATRINFQTLFILANQSGKTNRLAYIQPLLDWAESIISFSKTVATALQSQSTANDVMAYRWDLTGVDATDPHITLLGAIQIED